MFIFKLKGVNSKMKVKRVYLKRNPPILRPTGNIRQVSELEALLGVVQGEAQKYRQFLLTTSKIYYTLLTCIVGEDIYCETANTSWGKAKWHGIRGRGARYSGERGTVFGGERHGIRRREARYSGERGTVFGGERHGIRGGGG